MLIAWVLNILGLAFGTLLGARALLNPRWAQRLVRLQPDEQGGGFAEFRATYGGLFFGVHFVALAMSLFYQLGGEYVIGVAATGAAAALAAGWGMTAIARAVSIWRDNTGTNFNRLSIAIEAIVSLAIGAPWVVWVVAG
jgi:hypothetical protein